MRATISSQLVQYRNWEKLRRNILKNEHIVEQLHPPDGENCGGADAVSLGGPLVMQVVAA